MTDDKSKMPVEIMFIMARQLAYRNPDFALNFVLPPKVPLVPIVSSPVFIFEKIDHVRYDARDLVKKIDEFETEFKDMPPRGTIDQLAARNFELTMRLCEAHIEINTLKDSLRALWNKRGTA